MEAGDDWIDLLGDLEGEPDIMDLLNDLVDPNQVRFPEDDSQAP